MNIYFLTFGCKVNLYETENMKQIFSGEGYGIASDEAGADIFIINSCTVTGTGDKKLKKEIRRLRRCYPTSIIVLSGCFPQAFAEEASNIPEVDIVTGTKNRAELPKLLSEFTDSRSRVVSVCEYSRKEQFEHMRNKGYENNTRAFVKIQDGCGMFCTYCIIPYSRGNFRSKPLDDVISEITELAQKGFKEVVLVGINLSFYGVDIGKRLIDAVEAVCQIDGIERVRLGSLEPEMITLEDIKRLAALKKLCPQFHLSLQSGCDKTLKAMNRRYITADYEALVNALRENFENCSITTDIMVGFPGETEEDFEASLRFAEKISFAKAHIFPYSPRKGTPAAEMAEQVPEDVKHRRAAQMGEAMEKCHSKFMESQVGLTVPVLFEREKSDKIPRGYTPNYTLVKILTKNSNKSLRNQLFYVKIIRIEKDCCIGEIVS
ncbi:MAG: tRNA (N(6)-L-threonylcarbamoyladenosine(37)-C(2))-methylthiotransferase MtaB [Oscillospiraceae bacterium]|nr:tRNA (N(6)-L-threonylcarbamoyladenosine(37)-C(2))-methylthiotransferase MtaB [Oscillospiraceae bacterium]